jgi:cysteine desulfurase
MKLFLDSNAHVPMSQNTINQYFNYLSSDYAHGHPLSPNKTGVISSSLIEDARAKIQTLLGCPYGSVICFTSSCTEAAQWGLSILKNKSNNIHYSPIEHSAINSNIHIFNNKTKLKIKNSGVVDDFFKKESSICIHVHNEFGTIQPINDLNSDILFSDMCQSIGKTTVSLKDMPVDIAVFGAHKFGGPPSVGFLYLKNQDWWEEFGFGSRYNFDRVGTPDTAGIVATAAALEESLLNMPERINNMKVFQDYIEPRLEEFGFEIIGKNEKRVPNTTFIKTKGNSFEYLLNLSQNNIFVGLGSACGSIYNNQSTSTQAIGYNEDGNYFLRISQHGDYSLKEAEYFIDQFKKII